MIYDGLPNININNIFSEIINLLKNKLLHSKVLNELLSIISKYFPDYVPITEIQGLAGGRNDLIAFKYNTRKILFEIFATANQVSRDLRLLDNTIADIKIAIIIDKEIDKKVLEKILRENPENNYPYLYISQILDKTKIHNTVNFLRDIIFKKDRDLMLEKINKKISYREFLKKCKEENIIILTKVDDKENFTIKNMFLTIVSNKILKLLNDNYKVLELIKWLNDDELIEFVFFKIELGFNIFLYTDFKENYSIESDIEFLDWLRLMNEEKNPRIFLSLNKILYDIDDNFFMGELKINREIKFTIGHSQIHEGKNGVTVTFSIPKNTNKIEIYKPINFNNEKEIDWEDYKKMMEFV